MLTVRTRKLHRTVTLVAADKVLTHTTILANAWSQRGALVDVLIAGGAGVALLA